ncbi:MAG: ABC transporter substrate-binding protein [Acidimicrobiia bacterium]|nr:ABC transporter substrate-binding protein [Acidimicrobiia bacterium]
MEHTSRPWWRVLAVLALLGLFASACGGDDDPEAEGPEGSIETGTEGTVAEVDEITPGGKIIVGLESETNEWSPASGQFASGGWTVALTFYDPLITIDAEGEFKPFLAESMEPNEDLTEWTLTLREGVLFHDGTPLDAETLKWNFDTLHFADGVRNQGALKTAGVTGMEVVDDLTVKYVLSEPNAAFPDQLRSYAGLPVSQVAYEADPVGFSEHPVGTGPFVFQEWRRDDRLIVTKNENYWMKGADGQQLPYLDEIEFRPIPDDEARVNSLASDDIQVLQTLRGTSVKRVRALIDEGGFAGNLYVGNESSITVINTLVPPLDDVRIRRALAFANDQEAMATVRDDDGLVPPSTGFFSSDSPWYSEDAVSEYPAGPDPDAARALVEEYMNDAKRSDGKPVGDPVTINYQCQPDPSLLEGAQLLQGLWGDVGIELNLEQVDQSTMITNVVGSPDTETPYLGNFQLTCFRAGGGEGDPLTALQSFFGPVPTSSGNFTNFTSPEIDEALDTLRTRADFAERYAAVETISRIAAQNVPVVWNVGTPTMIGYRDDVVGIPDWTLPDGSMGQGTPGARARFHETFLAQ